MKTKTYIKNKINVVTLGCSKNLFDSEVLLSKLKANNFDISHESEVEDYQTVIINTCGFIESAKQESIDTILNFIEAKKEGKIEKIFVSGCLSGRYKKELEESMPEVDAFFGTDDSKNILKTLNADYKKELVGARLLTTPSHYAYFKISEGCDRKCSFCAIPLIRGKHKSTEIEQLITSAQELAKIGVKELILIAQDLTYYGKDIYGKRNLAYLLEKLAEIEGIEWIRLHYAYPNSFPLDVLDVINNSPKICNYIDMPLQHCNNEMLKLMKRGSTKEKITKLVNDIRQKIDNVAIRTTLIAGFPNETDEMHEEMKEWIKEMKFDRLGIFTYSHEENTSAHELDDNVPENIKQKRAQTIMDIQSEISFELNQNKIGKIFKVLIDRKETNCCIGRTQYDSPDVDNEVIIENSNLEIGKFYEVKINSASEFDLFGDVI